MVIIEITEGHTVSFIANYSCNGIRWHAGLQIMEKLCGFDGWLDYRRGMHFWLEKLGMYYSLNMNEL